MIHLIAMSGLVCVMPVPRAFAGWRGLAGLARAAVLIATFVWYGLGARLLTAMDRAVVLLGTPPVLGGLAIGLAV